MKVNTEDNIVIFSAENYVDCYNLGILACDIRGKMIFKTGEEVLDELSLEVNVDDLIGHFGKLRRLANK